ncbi:MAG: Maf family protein [Gammaproteobacteria bacterium]|nr:Maf family protein [Gammaproteobacteria bacterium]
MSTAQFILASGSPRRRELLDQIGFSYSVQPSDIDESIRSGEDPVDYVKRMARSKAMQNQHQDSFPVLAADTICVIDGLILGKPDSIDNARQMLAQLSARTHTVITAVSLYQTHHQQTLSMSEVTFKPLIPSEIDAYCQTGEPSDKAGAYAIQGQAGAFIQTIKGSYSGIVGLPLYETTELLKQNTIYPRFKTIA